jgi:Response regulator containing CheY-like receiver, AAA-type ATPase, and DNA-binding domains
MKILLVEDNLDLNNTIREVLELNGYIVDSAFDGKEALNFIENSSYDVIILDLMLPDINGLEILKTIRIKDVDTPVIILTAKNPN